MVRQPAPGRPADRSLAENRDAEHPYEIPRAIWLALAVVGVVLSGVILYTWREQDDGLAAIQAGVALGALLAALSVGIYAYSQYREWAAENHRDADYDLYIQISHRKDVPGIDLPQISHEDNLPDEPMFTLERQTAVVRAIVHVHDRFPLRNCILNVVVPSEWDVQPLRESATHYPAGTVTPNSRVNPNAAQDHAVRFTCQTRDLSPKGHTAAEVEIRRVSESKEPIRLLVELSCTPAAASGEDNYRFALLAPWDYEQTSPSL